MEQEQDVRLCRAEEEERKGIGRRKKRRRTVLCNTLTYNTFSKFAVAALICTGLVSVSLEIAKGAACFSVCLCLSPKILALANWEEEKFLEIFQRNEKKEVLKDIFTLFFSSTFIFWIMIWAIVELIFFDRLIL